MTSSVAAFYVQSSICIYYEDAFMHANRSVEIIVISNDINLDKALNTFPCGSNQTGI